MSEARPPGRPVNVFFPPANGRNLAGWRRRADILLRRLGPTWRAAPVRRGFQVVCLGLYLYLFFHVSWPYADAFSHRVFSDKEWLPVEVFLWLDPLVGLSTAVAARSWNVAMIGALAVLVLGVFFPRGFCGYLCPLGTMLDGFEALVGRHLRRFHRPPAGGWSDVRFYLLAAVFGAALCGVLLSGFVAAIPVLTRGLLFTAGHVQLGLLKHWSMVPPANLAIWASVGMFAAVFLLGFLGPRFWCRHVCPSGALLSLPALLRVGRRHVDSRCVQCGRCVETCPFDAIHPDFRTRPLRCAFCQTCGGVCTAQAIRFELGGPWPDFPAAPPLTSAPLSRRSWLFSGAGAMALALTTRVTASNPPRPIRPPGSVPEAQFLDLCIRCEQCLKVCPGPVLQAAGWEHGFEALWTPVAVFPHAGCHQDCNFCTQVCPTGAIRPLSLEEKRRARMGLAVLDTDLCLPYRGERDCQLCADECNAAGYRAIEMREIQLDVGQVPEGMFAPEEVEQMGRIRVPVVLTEACVGCGLCEYRCHSANHIQRRWLPQSAIVVRAEPSPRPAAS